MPRHWEFNFISNNLRTLIKSLKEAVWLNGFFFLPCMFNWLSWPELTSYKLLCQTKQTQRHNHHDYHHVRNKQSATKAAGSKYLSNPGTTRTRKISRHLLSYLCRPFVSYSSCPLQFLEHIRLNNINCNFCSVKVGIYCVRCNASHWIFYNKLESYAYCLFPPLHFGKQGKKHILDIYKI